MKDIEIVVFNDKSWVRLTEYQKVKEENEQLQQKWLESEFEKSKLVSQIEKFKEGKQYETCPYRSTDMGCDYCDYRDRDLKNEWEENE